MLNCILINLGTENQIAVTPTLMLTSDNALQRYKGVPETGDSTKCNRSQGPGNAVDIKRKYFFRNIMLVILIL